MADQNPYRQAREVENDALGRMTGPSPKEVGWDEGFAAGRAAATPDPHDWSAAILTLRQAMCTPAGREQVERELLRPFAASPDERLREAERCYHEYQHNPASDDFGVCAKCGDEENAGSVLDGGSTPRPDPTPVGDGEGTEYARLTDEHLREAQALLLGVARPRLGRTLNARVDRPLAAAGRPQPPPDERLREAAERLTRAVEVLDLSDPRLDDAGPYETLTVPQSAAAWRDIRRFVAEARSALAAADREKPEPSGCCRVCGGSGHVGDGCHGCAPPVSDDPKEKPDA